jgi:hypothetical protein
MLAVMTFQISNLSAMVHQILDNQNQYFTGLIFHNVDIFVLTFLNFSLIFGFFTTFFQEWSCPSHHKIIDITQDN